MPSYPDDQTYRIDEPAIDFTHNGATVLTYPNQHDLCGVLGYDPIWYDDYVDDSTEPLSYEPGSKTFSFYSEDFSLESVENYIIEVYFEEYP